MGSKRKRAKWGYCRGCVGVDDAQRVRDNAETKISKAEVGGATSGDFAKAFIVGLIGHGRLLLGRLVGWLGLVCDIPASDHMFPSKFARARG
jgi:hypothetical protein